MTPLQLARQCCANWEPDGGCLGVRFGASGQIVSCSPIPRCWIAEGKPCRYFEEWVLTQDRDVAPLYATGIKLPFTAGTGSNRQQNAPQTVRKGSQRPVSSESVQAGV